MSRPIKGQRWVSDSEPELGLGIILHAEFNQVKVFFPAVNGLRDYALESAPLRRVEYKEGDRIKSHEGDNLLVEKVENRNGLLIYKTEGRELLIPLALVNLKIDCLEGRLMSYVSLICASRHFIVNVRFGNPGFADFPEAVWI